MNSIFEQWRDQDICDLVSAYPIAWIVPQAVQTAPTQMPMLIDTDAQGRPVSMTGHFPKNRPGYAELCEHPRALFLFNGPQAYISPTFISKKDWAPTWNFASAAITADVRFDESVTDESLQRIVAHMEAPQGAGWSIEALGARYEKLRDRVIGFRAEVISISARFKLGQDESEQIRAEIIDHFDADPLAAWMRRFN